LELLLEQVFPLPSVVPQLFTAEAMQLFPDVKLQLFAPIPGQPFVVPASTQRLEPFSAA
jgi:hypothetical protein